VPDETVEVAVDRSDASALADLQMHWDEAYAIGLDGDIWLARFHGSADELRAHTSTDLRELIRADYAYRQQVSRVRAAAAGTEAADDALDDQALDDSALDEQALDDSALDEQALDNSALDNSASGRGGQAGGTGSTDSSSGSAGHVDSSRGAGIPGPDSDDLDDADFDDEDYAAHFDRARVGTAQIGTAQIDTGHPGSARSDSAQAGGPDLGADNEPSPGGGHRDDTEPGREGGLGRASLPHSGYANLRGERMST
jgi:hypothetical protein